MNKISCERKKLGITQMAFARMLGWSQSRLGNYEVGARSPNLATCREIVSAFNSLGSSCSLDEIFPPRECGEWHDPRNLHL
ncbi:helix-turn-helix transcriptional regulator [Candidatus Symbiopectobacterium sp. NZEC127]|uniref:helix-turn-helix transcriptional regulator n=1 Tax=Candidatus Symbiopectobacterium sp. NZEC127 TaxID=2820472 RepID=UPI002227BD40|nr:helix-turn-helix transcriptional regulator [Candidatus Symbiopectobacterium sp. NZEC127]MCW2485747.1 helix-turn-helix transcriptional regulator [Candidatus Symbiopectobacterium sp. NZEC127]